MGQDMSTEQAQGHREDVNYIQMEGALFEAVQRDHIFPDSKTFVDAVPTTLPGQILSTFEEERGRDDFDLYAFIDDNFALPVDAGPVVDVSERDSMIEHIKSLWPHLTYPAHEDVSENNTLIPLPNKYVVPGGRFREICYWDSYFTVEGLAACGNMETVEATVRNMAYLIRQYGFVPNGNRLYYLSRSQPPMFASMLQLLERYKGTDAVTQFLPQLEREYRFWMDGVDGLTEDARTHRRVVQVEEDTVLNRYWDDRPKPRPESYHEDVAVAQRASNETELYRHIRAACESGWDFSSRWLGPHNDMHTIRTADILPVDLNTILYEMERLLAKWYEHMEEREKASTYQDAASRRRNRIHEYFWNEEEGFFFDYNWQEDEQTDTWSLAGVYPLFYGIATQEQADRVADALEEKFLETGGLLTTLEKTGQQWDAPNGWAPLHWIAVNGLLQYGHTDLANTIAERWLALNEYVHDRDSKMLEKYDVTSHEKRAGGGEYELQDGFGWTNAVAIALIKGMNSRQNGTPLTDIAIDEE